MLDGFTNSLLGAPLNFAAYDYTGAVLFNAYARALWARFTTYLRREITAQLGLTQQALTLWNRYLRFIRKNRRSGPTNSALQNHGTAEE
jgi:hypothetical protein